MFSELSSKLTAALQKLTGRVVLMARIGPDGAVADVEVISSTAPGVGFEQAAVEAVRRWVWRPAEVDGRPVAVSMTVVVQFSLH